MDKRYPTVSTLSVEDRKQYKKKNIATTRTSSIRKENNTNTGGRNAKHDQADEELAVHRP